MNATEKPRFEASIMPQTSYAPTGRAADYVTSIRRRLGLNPALQAFWVLRVGFTTAVIIAGVDKFFHVLVDWDQYVAPRVASMVGGNGHVFMLVIGVVEILAGIGVAIRPRVFGYVVSAWLLGIIVNLLMVPGFYDIALRDLGLAIGALALGRLSETYGRRPAKRTS